MGKNQKIVVGILVALVVILAGTTIYFAVSKNAYAPSASQTVPVQSLAGKIPTTTNQPVPASDKNTVNITPTENENSVPSCGKLAQFKNNSWSNSLEALYKSVFLKPQGLEGDLWLEGPTMAGELSSCKIKDFFIFIPEFFEFGCGRILKYDIKNNKLVETVVQPPTACADNFGQITKNYVEYSGIQGDGGQGKNYHGRYYFNEDRIENIK